ncbi:hypothetical protein CVT26_007806 [Gymnopilus dilepis]|uniref:Protein kinase domain-containing protein n=1 Tax=Gymnopilus dilepis TaxID=231916 RepID=A0A409W7U7_9AGAR|nr:hypothetical protein CVT26_007806 [Gymnopilus dilepis]
MDFALGLETSARLLYSLPSRSSSGMKIKGAVLSSSRADCRDGGVYSVDRARFAQSLNMTDCIVEQLRSGEAFQLVRVVDSVDGTLKVVKIVSRSMIDDDAVLDGVKWLRRRRLNCPSYSKLVDNFNSPHDWYLVFECARVTLKDILAREDMDPLPVRHVRAIMHQLVNAVDSLHRRSMMHLDICPAMIEIVDPSTIEERVYTEEGCFVKKVVLCCTEIRVVFYGDVGSRTDRDVGTDQYRAPELVFGWASRSGTDTFSIGCVFSELLTGRPMFPPCSEEELYVLAKAHVFEAVLGEFPPDVVHSVSFMHQGLFNSSDELKGFYDLSEDLRGFLCSIKTIQEEIEDDDAEEVLRSMTMISPADRVHLSDVLSFAYFSRAGADSYD